MTESMEKFINSQLEYLRDEAVAEKKKNSIRGTVTAKVVNHFEDQEVGSLVDFECSLKEKLKVGESSCSWKEI